MKHHSLSIRSLTSIPLAGRGTVRAGQFGWDGYLVTTGERIVDLMKSVNRKHATTFIFSTHDPQVMKHAQRVICLKDGVVVSA